MEEQVSHKRRVRYSGTHPKRFEEKYKELNPEKYAADVQHILDKGHTPAGMHVSIMVQEILDFLQIKPGQSGLDATLAVQLFKHGAGVTAIAKGGVKPYLPRLNVEEI